MIKFGTDGWRSLMTADFNEENVQRVAFAISRYVLSNDSKAYNGLVVGYDTRENSERFSKIIAQVLRNNNVPVTEMTRPMPTPLTAFAVKMKNAFGAVMITASHNPPKYNGIKYITKDAGPADVDVTRQIEKNIETAKTVKNLQIYQMSDTDLYDPLLDYRQHLKRLIDFKAIKNSGLKILINPVYGAGYGLLDQILQLDADIECDSINNYPDPEFGGGMPEPAGKNLQELYDGLINQGAQIGLALDGDGDRFAVIDHTGSSPPPNLTISLIADHLAERGMNGRIVRTLATTHMLDRIAYKHGLGITETKVGFKYIAKEMLKGDVLIGGEESGGISIGGHIPEKDGLLGNLLLLEAMAYKKANSIKELTDDLYAKYGKLVSKRVDHHLSEEQKTAVLSTVKDFKPSEVNGGKVIDHYDQDGFKFVLEDGSWFMVRPSGTEPVVRVYAEASSEKSLSSLFNFVDTNLIK